jgi:hypothetical protein
VLMGSASVSCFDKLRVTGMDRASRLSGRFRWLEPSPRSHSGQSRGGFGEQTHRRAGYFEVVGGCGDRCRGGPDDSDHAGMLSGWITSIVSVSAPLMGPEDRMVDWVTGTRFLDKWVSGPSGAAIFWRATSLVWVS